MAHAIQTSGRHTKWLSSRCSFGPLRAPVVVWVVFGVVVAVRVDVYGSGCSRFIDPARNDASFIICGAYVAYSGVWGTLSAASDWREK